MNGEPSGAIGRTEWWGRLGLLAFGTLFALGACELLVRLFQPMPPGFSWVRRDGLVLHTPGMEAVYARQEFSIPISINREGLRGPAIVRAKPKGRLRILLLGDSYAEGFQVRWEDLLSTRLARLLNAGPGPPVEIINAGVSGYGTTDELALLEKLGWEYHPDLVLLAFCIHNDLRNNLEHPFYDFSATPPRRAEPSPPTGAALAVLRAKEFLSRRSQLYQLVRDRLADLPRMNRTLQRWGLRRGQGNAIAAKATAATVEATAWFQEPNPEELLRGLAYTRQVLARIRQEAGEHHANLMVVWIPIREQILDPQWQEFRAGFSLPELNRWRPQELLSRMSKELDILALDLAPAFHKAATREPLYYRIDGHWTPAGHRIAAEALFPILEEWRQQHAAKLITEGLSELSGLK